MHLSKKWSSDKVKENCKANLKAHCVMQLAKSVGKHLSLGPQKVVRVDLYGKNLISMEKL